ncbi:MAG TPA: cyclase family protein [Vicinamibacterales bacterium]|nr:cyclase family protein [Vicinamibacterales bacterium]
MSGPARLLDVSVLLRPGMPTYPGNPPFALEPVQRIANGDTANVSKLELGTHTGTHIDAPRHFFDDRPGVDALPLDILIGRARVIDLPVHGGITVAHLEAAKLTDDLRVLLRTPNSALWKSPEFHPDFTYVTGDAARYFVEHGVKLVGVDYLSVEQFKKPGAPAHHALLGHGVVIVEGLDLSEAAAGTYEMYCLPLRLAGGDGAPARVVLRA